MTLHHTHAFMPTLISISTPRGEMLIDVRINQHLNYDVQGTAKRIL